MESNSCAGGVSILASLGSSTSRQAVVAPNNWTCDATVVDNLNRATTIGGVSRTYDVLGNTLTIGSSKTMTWDVLNRMLSLDNGTTTTDYAYRADGLRVSKAAGTKTTSYFYDGQKSIAIAMMSAAGIGAVGGAIAGVFYVLARNIQASALLQEIWGE